MNPDKVIVPASLPDVAIVRKDMCDYYFEVQRFDKRLAGMLDRQKVSSPAWQELCRCLSFDSDCGSILLPCK